jgi:hypothetical protein
MTPTTTGWTCEVSFPSVPCPVTVTVSGSPSEEQRQRFLEIRARWAELFELIRAPLRRRVLEVYDGAEAVFENRIELGGIDIEPDGRRWSAQFCYRHEGGVEDDFGFFADWDGDQPKGQIDVVD